MNYIRNCLIVFILVSFFQVECSVKSDDLDDYGHLDFKQFLSFMDEESSLADNANLGYKFAATDAERVAFTNYLAQRQEEAFQNISSSGLESGLTSHDSPDSSKLVWSMHEKADAHDTEQSYQILQFKEKKVKKKKSPGAKVEALDSPAKAAAMAKKEFENAKREKQRQDNLATVAFKKLQEEKELAEKEARKNEKKLENQRKQIELNKKIKADQANKIKANLLEEQFLNEALERNLKEQKSIINTSGQVSRPVEHRSAGATIAVSSQDPRVILNDQNLRVCLNVIELGNRVVRAFDRESALLQYGRELSQDQNFLPSYDFIVACLENILETSRSFNDVIDNDVLLDNWTFSRFCTTVDAFFAVYELGTEGAIPDQIRDILDRIYLSKVDNKTKLVIKQQGPQVKDERIKSIDIDIKRIESMLHKVSLHGL